MEDEEDSSLFTVMSCKCHNICTCIRCQDISKYLHDNIAACCHFLTSLWFAADTAGPPDGAKIMSERETTINVFCFSESCYFLESQPCYFFSMSSPITNVVLLFFYPMLEGIATLYWCSNVLHSSSFQGWRST